MRMTSFHFIFPKNLRSIDLNKMLHRDFNIIDPFAHHATDVTASKHQGFKIHTISGYNLFTFIEAIFTEFPELLIWFHSKYVISCNVIK